MEPLQKLNNPLKVFIDEASMESLGRVGGTKTLL